MVKMQKLNSETYLVEIRCTNSFQVSRNKLQHQFFACPIVKSIFYVKLISQYKWSTRKWSFQCREDRCSTITVLKKISYIKNSSKNVFKSLIKNRIQYLDCSEYLDCEAAWCPGEVEGDAAPHCLSGNEELKCRLWYSKIFPHYPVL